MAESDFQIIYPIAQIVTKLGDIWIESFVWDESETVYDNCLLCSYGSKML